MTRNQQPAERAIEMSNHWVINIGGYGAFLFEGTEDEAEEMRRHKARWERGVGRKRLATEAEVSADCPDYENLP